ncbi:MAG: twin-arginine translocase TatA/TatE family subunit, partial [Phycisphaerales bacterium]
MIANIPNAGTLGLGFIQNLGPLELLIIFAVLLLLFGRRLPEVGKSLGKGIVEFKKGISGVEDDANRAAQQPPPGSGYQQALPGQG